nr:pigment-dispersing hormone A peptides-like isoform X1 [Procambarus clarkii]
MESLPDSFSYFFRRAIDVFYLKIYIYKLYILIVGVCLSFQDLQVSVKCIPTGCFRSPRWPLYSPATGNRMRNAVVVLVLVAMVAVLARAQELKYPEREVVAELAAQILRVAQGPWGTMAGGPHKRNSELINSILGLPKVMNEAGRR